MAEIANPVPAGLADRARAEGPLWPWICRFFWAPARDLHPSRRAALLPGVNDAGWARPGVLRHASSHLLASLATPDDARWDSSSAAFRIALLPLQPLAALARRVGLVLARPQTPDGKQDLDETERLFVAERAPLYWRGALAAPGTPPDAAGWNALCTAVAAPDSGALRQRFEWKAPLNAPPVEMTLPPQAALALVLRILRELDEPWSSLFVNTAR